MLIAVIWSMCYVRLFVDSKRLLDAAVRQHLELDSPSKPDLTVQCFPYESVFSELNVVCAALAPKDKMWICDKASCALTQVIPKVSQDTSEKSNSKEAYTGKIKVVPKLSPEGRHIQKGAYWEEIFPIFTANVLSFWIGSLDI